MTAFRSAKNRKNLTDSQISGLIHLSQSGGLKYVISDKFYIIHEAVKMPINNITELLAFIRKMRE
jgi:hypothetical protein